MLPIEIKPTTFPIPSYQQMAETLQSWISGNILTPQSSALFAGLKKMVEKDYVSDNDTSELAEPVLL